MKKNSKRPMSISPPRMIILTFILLIIVGTILLVLPISSADGETINWLDAFFTATSAICVNGLSTIDISSSLSAFGQTVVMILIQIGGLGFKIGRASCRERVGLWGGAV